jgi:starch phosphorylase
MPPGPAYDGREDVARAVSELAERLPSSLAALADLAYNYFWAWSGAGALFRDVDPARWRRSGLNPRFVLETLPPRRFAALAASADFVARVQRAAALLAAELARPVAATGIAAERPVAYLCSEFGVHCSLPLYGGGLGVLAGDFVKAASDLALPVVGLGLMYRQGYFRQRIDSDGWQVEWWSDSELEHLPTVLVTGANGEPLVVELVIRDRPVRVQIWRIDVGRVPVYLLDTDRDDNHLADRWITSRLYVGDRHTRLAQYAVLGVGGVRALDALGIVPSLIHLNEGHGGFASFERMRRLLAAGESHAAALAQVRATTVFTTHTPVAAGNEWYAPHEIDSVMHDFITRLGIPREAFYDLGRLHPGRPEEPANITVLALRTSRAANAVSRKHCEVARRMWQPLWPDRSVEGVPIQPVTNGIHSATWIAEPMRDLLDRHLAPDWLRRVDEPGLWARLADVPDHELWAVRSVLREQLVEYARTGALRARLGRGEPQAYTEAVARMFRPDVLTIGFARRVATYKRLHLLTDLGEAGFAMLRDEARPLQLVLAGKAHPQDRDAKGTLQQIFRMRSVPGVAERVAFLEDYDLHMAPYIVAGVDLWLNLPRAPLEACGTSGMKVALNGGLNLSVLDGWWAEGFDGENGWAVPGEEGGDPVEQDRRDAERVLRLIQDEVLPLFYERGADGVPHAWLARVKRSMETIAPRFSAVRMAREYAAMYAPRG